MFRVALFCLKSGFAGFAGYYFIGIRIYLIWGNDLRAAFWFLNRILLFLSNNYSSFKETHSRQINFDV